MSYRILKALDSFGHFVGLDRAPWFHRICDAYDRTLRRG